MFAELIVVFDAKRADAALIQSLNMGLATLSVKYLHINYLSVGTLLE
jgi:hypothetical protein